MKKRKRKIIAVVLVAICIYFSLHFIVNQMASSNYDDLNETDKAMLTEVAVLSQGEQQSELWPGYQVVGNNLFALKNTWEGGYLINPSVEPNSIFAKQVIMPGSSGIKVYRVAGFSPDMFQFLFPSNFNSMDQHCSVLGSDVYFLRYNDNSFNKTYDSGHFSTMLAHERFHYDVQKEWKGTSRPDTDTVTANDLALLAKQYDVLDGLADLRDSGQARKEEVVALANEYISATEQRVSANSGYMLQEQQAETIEGTAMHVGVEASRLVDYPYDIMKVSKDGGEAVVSFSRIASMIRDGSLEQSSIGTEWVYQSGALLCWVLDELEVSDWQQQLNNQTSDNDNPVTLYNILKKACSS